jgi:hypothetical protein
MRSCIRSPAHRRIMPDRIAPIPLARNLARSSAPDPRLSLSAARTLFRCCPLVRVVQRRIAKDILRIHIRAGLDQHPCTGENARVAVCRLSTASWSGVSPTLARGEISGDSEISFRNRRSGRRVPPLHVYEGGTRGAVASFQGRLAVP